MTTAARPFQEEIGELAPCPLLTSLSSELHAEIYQAASECILEGKGKLEEALGWTLFEPGWVQL